MWHSIFAKYARRRDNTNKNQEKQQTLETDSQRLHVRELLNFKITILSLLKYIKDKIGNFDRELEMIF